MQREKKKKKTHSSRILLVLLNTASKVLGQLLKNGIVGGGVASEVVRQAELGQLGVGDNVEPGDGRVARRGDLLVRLADGDAVLHKLQQRGLGLRERVGVVGLQRLLHVAHGLQLHLLVRNVGVDAHGQDRPRRARVRAGARLCLLPVAAARRAVLGRRVVADPYDLRSLAPFAVLLFCLLGALGHGHEGEECGECRLHFGCEKEKKCLMIFRRSGW